MARPDFSLIWGSSRPSIPAISSGNYAAGWDAYLGPLPPLADDHDYVMNLQDKRANWLGGQMLKAVGHEWQSDITYDAYAITRSPVDGKLYRSLIGSNTGNEPSVSPSQWALGVSQGGTLDTLRINVASAATVNLTTSAPDTRHINITGTTTITQFTVAAGLTYFVRFDAALTLTNNANIVTQRGANITVAAGDTCIIRATAANVVEVLCFTKAVQPFNDFFISSQQTITLGGGLTIAHGLSSQPFFVSLEFVCTTPDAGYAVGDRLQRPSGGSGYGGGSAVEVWPDSTNLNVRFGTASYSIGHKTTGAQTVMTLTSWRAVLRAFV